jgi:hypothetical protein
VGYYYDSGWQSTNTTGNVDIKGSITNVTNITASGEIKATSTTAIH